MAIYLKLGFLIYYHLKFVFLYVRKASFSHQKVVYQLKTRGNFKHSVTRTKRQSWRILQEEHGKLLLTVYRGLLQKVKELPLFLWQSKQKIMYNVKDRHFFKSMLEPMTVKGLLKFEIQLHFCYIYIYIFV